MYTTVFFFVECVVRENIHTLTTEGIGNSRGVGGQSPRKFQRGWGVRGEIFVQRVGSRSTFFVYVNWRHLPTLLQSRFLSGSKDSKRLTVSNCLQSRFGVLTLVSQLKHSKSFGLAKKKKKRWSRRLAKFRINLPFATPYWLQPSLNFDLHWA